MRLLIHAPNIHSGGGAVLLRDLLGALSPEVASSPPTLLIVDQRMVLPPAWPAQSVRRVAPTVWARLSAERMLASEARAQDTVLCLGNLPPLWAVKGRVYVFVQNRYLLDWAMPTTGLPLRARLRLAIERRWLGRGARSARILVQTPAMRALAHTRLGVDAWVIPYRGALAGTSAEREPAQRHAVRSQPSIQSVAGQPRDGAQFLYVASAEPHKNHARLLAAWELLAEHPARPRLHLTVDPASPIAEAVARLGARGVAVANHGLLDRAGLEGLYARCSALVFPSLSESFGLPLLEAAERGMPIIAAERDYVRDVVVPDESFDPLSPLSIARAVGRFLGDAPPCVQPLTPQAFVARLLQPDPAP